MNELLIPTLEAHLLCKTHKTRTIYGWHFGLEVLKLQSPSLNMDFERMQYLVRDW